MPAVLNINARSPFIVEINEAAQTSSKVELFIWNGTGSAPATPTHTLSKNVPSATNLKTTYDVSPFVREFINFDVPLVLYNTVELTNTNQWCNVRIKRYKNTATLLTTTDYVAYDGYGYFSQGYNPYNGDFSLPDNSTHYFYNDNLTIPIASFRAYITAPSTIKWTNADTSVNTTLISTTGVYNIPIVSEISDAGNGVTVSIINATVLNGIKFIPIEECKYDVITIDFVNKCGAWQKAWFFKASSNSIETSGAEYNMLSANVNYDVNVGSRKVFNVNGTESIKVNSGWVNDDYAETIQQILLSERILVDGKPAKMKTKGIEKQKQINTKMINYQLEFEYAYDIINNTK
jgi:hypothetical protein